MPRWAPTALFTSITKVHSLCYRSVLDGQGIDILWEMGNIERLKGGLQHLTTLTEVGMEQLEDTIEHSLPPHPFSLSRVYAREKKSFY